MLSIDKPVCRVEECTRTSTRRGYCDRHYRKWMKYGDATVVKIESHRMTKTGEYRSWYALKRRCYNKKNLDYERYGGRGTRVCPSIFGSFSYFYSVVGPKPTPKHSIDRKNSQGHYSCGTCEHCIEHGWPMNVQWATARQQTLNRRLKAGAESGLRGVTRVPRVKRECWTAYVFVGAQRIHIGTFEDKDEAGYVRDQVAMQLHGDEVLLNFEY